MKDKLVIFDMDGTLFDTKDVNFRAYCEAFEKSGLKIKIDYKYYCDFCNGSNYKTFLPQIAKGITDSEMESIHNYKKKVYSSYLKHAKKNEHLFEIMKLLSAEYIIALVTSASKKNTMDILESFNVMECFDIILTQEDVGKTKPDPECFLKAMEKAGISKDKTLIFEDSNIGLQAAKASGANFMKVYGFN